MYIHLDSYILAHLLIPNLCFSFQNKLYQIHNQYQYKCNNMHVICNKSSLYKKEKTLTYIYPTVLITLMPIFISCIFTYPFNMSSWITFPYFCLKLSATELLPPHAQSKETYPPAPPSLPYTLSSSNTPNPSPASLDYTKYTPPCQVLVPLLHP